MADHDEFEGYFSYERLDVYRVAREYYAKAKSVADRLPPKEIDLRRQWLRSCTSVCSNTAEACQETRPAEKGRIFRIARREIGEANSCSRDVFVGGYMTSAEAQELSGLANRISAMLWGMIKRNSH